MNKVFISYSRRNKLFAERIARDLNDAGLDVWIDFRQIHGGEMWQEEIFRGIERSDIVVICLSPDAVESEWVQREVNAAREQKKFIIPVMVVNAITALEATPSMNWLLNVHFIDFQTSYEESFPELLKALPGKRRVNAYDSVDALAIQNPFKGLEAFQQTDAPFFFGREKLIEKSLARLREDRRIRFLAIVGASGSGKSSLVRAGVLPAVRDGKLPGSDHWRIGIFTPGSQPIDALSKRLAPLIENRDSDQINALLHESPKYIDVLVDQTLKDAEVDARLLLVIDQFEEVFTRAGENEASQFLTLIQRLVTQPNGRAIVMITMRADFFDRLSRYPHLAELFEQENMVIVTEMTPQELLRTIEGPAQSAGLLYDTGLPQRILEDVRRQPGSLPLLQYALKELFMRREGRRMTTKAYEEIGGIRRALARHAEDIYVRLNAAQQAIMRRLLLRLVEVSESGEATRRRVRQEDLNFRDVPPEAVDELIDMLTSAESRLLIASREIASNKDREAPIVLVEVSHEALIREWDRFKGWVAENIENLRLGGEILQASTDWRTSNKDKAYLLTGNRFLRAEAWMEQADATQLQREFIIASEAENRRIDKLNQERIERELQLQRQAANRLRLFTAVLILGLAGAIVLSVVAINAQREAERQRSLVEDRERLALENEAQAISLAQAASANRAFVDADTDLAVMLAVFANEVTAPPPQSERILADVVFSPGTRFVFESQQDSVQSVALRHDGLIGIGGAGNVVIVWDTFTGNEIIRLGEDGAGHDSAVTSVAVSPDGGYAVSADESGLMILWNLTTFEEVRRYDIVHTAEIVTVLFSPDGTHLLSGGRDSRVIVWDVFSGGALNVYVAPAPISALAYNADGTQFASGSENGAINIWSTGVTLTGHEAKISALAFSPLTNTHLLASDENGTLRLWNFSQQRELHRFRDQGEPIQALIYTPDGRTFFTGNNEGVITRWDVFSRSTLNTIGGHDEGINSLSISADGVLLFSGSDDGTARVWDVQQTDTIRTYEGHTSAREAIAVYNQDSQMIVSGAEDGRLLLWEPETGLIQQEFDTGNDVNTVAFNPSGLTIVSGHADGRLMIWDIASGASQQILTSSGSSVNTVIYMNTTQVIAGYADGGLIRWDLSTGQPVMTYGPSAGKDSFGHTAAVNDAAISPNGLYLLSASDDGTILAWAVEDGTVVNEFKGHNSAVTSITFDATGTRAVSGGRNNGSVILWNVEGNIGARTSRDSQIRTFSGHDGTITAVDFSPDSSKIITAATDGTLRMWDTTTGFEIRRFAITEPNGFNSAMFSADGQTALTASTDGALQEWRMLLTPGDMLTWIAATRYVPEPTCSEREQFRLKPFCQNGVPVATSTPFPPPQPTPTSIPPVLQIGGRAVVNTLNGVTLFLRTEANINAETVEQLPDGTPVTIVAGAVESDGFIWWYIRLDNGLEGWAVETIPESSLRTLVPVD